MMYWNGEMGTWGYILMWISFVLFWGAIITSIVLLTRSLGSAGSRQGQIAVRQPEDLLAERFARGEIDETEYRNRLAVLRPTN